MKEILIKKFVETQFAEYYGDGGIKFRVSDNNYILPKTRTLLSTNFTGKFIQEVSKKYEDTTRLVKERLSFTIGPNMDTSGKIHHKILLPTNGTPHERKELDAKIAELWYPKRNGCSVFMPHIGIQGQTTFADSSDGEWKGIPINLTIAIVDVLNNIIENINSELLGLEKKGVVLVVEEKDRK